MKFICGAVMACTLFLAGCSNNSEVAGSEGALAESTQTAQAQTTTTSSTADTYKSPLPDDAPVIKFVTDGVSPPFTFQDEYGNLIGLEVDIVRAIGEEEGFKVELYQEPWENLFTSIENGTKDIAAAGMGFNEERNQKYALSDSYIVDASSVVYTDLPIKNPKAVDVNELKGKRVGVSSDTIHEKYFQEYGNIELKTYPSAFALVSALVRGEVDVVVNSDGVLRYTIANNKVKGVKVSPILIGSSASDNVIMVMSKSNPELLKKVNSGIAKIKQNGKLAEIEKKWLSIDDNN